MCLGIPMKVTELKLPNRAIVEAGKISLEISLQLVDSVKVGDYVIVHSGFALEVMDLKAAQETLSLLNQMAESE